MKILNISILNPDTNKPVSVEEWMKDSNPARAEWILIETDELKPFLLHKRLVADGKVFSFQDALKEGNLLTRAQGLALYEARQAGINELLSKIDGDTVRGWVWTCEEDSDPDYASHAWFVYLYYGLVGYSTKTNGNQVRLVSAFTSL